MRTKDFIDGKRPNYYLIKSVLNNPLENKAMKSLNSNNYTKCQLDLPNVNYYRKHRTSGKSSTRPKTSISQMSTKSGELWEKPIKKTRFNEKTEIINKPTTRIKHRLRPQNYSVANEKIEKEPEKQENNKYNEKTIKEKILITDIIKDLKNLCEDDLENIKIYIKSLKDSKEINQKEGKSEKLNEQNLKKLELNNDNSYSPISYDLKSRSSKISKSVHSKVSSITNMYFY